MTLEETNALLALKKEHFKYREWLALKFAQDFIFMGKEPANTPYMDDFKSQYTQKQKSYVLKFIRMQEFANYMANTFSKKSWRGNLEGSSACSLDNRPD